MGIMDGLRRGLSAAGYAGADMYAKGALEDQRALIQAERDARLAEISEKATIGAEQRGLANRAAERGAIFQEGVAPERLAQTEAADRIKAEGTLRTKTGLMGATAKLAEDEFAAGANLRGQKSEEDAKTDKRKRDAETQAEIDRSNNPAYLSGKAKVARAGHIDDGAGLRAVQIEAANLSLSEKKEANALIKEFGETTDPTRQAQIKQALTVRGIIKPGEYDTEKVTKETTDAKTGEVTKTERTQRRGAVGATGTPEPQNVAAPAAALDYLAKNPGQKDTFIAKYGAAALPRSSEPDVVAGRPFYNANQSDLKRMASKPRGVSTSEANAAQAELDARIGEQRMKAF
jgi:hypothetical protein